MIEPTGTEARVCAPVAQPPSNAGSVEPTQSMLTDRAQSAMSALQQILDQIKSGDHRVVNVRITTSIGEPMVSSIKETAFSQKVQIELELVK